MVKLRRILWGCFSIMITVLICSMGFAATGSEIIGSVRVQILSSTLVRLEVKGPNGFEDRPTFHITNRNWPGATYTRTASGSNVLIQTADYTVSVPNAATSLSGITITKTDGTPIWRYSSLPENDRAWLPAITEDTWAWAIADNPRMVPASWGYNIAPSGVANYNTNGWDLNNNAPDLYVFLPKGNVRTLRSDLINLTGRTELIPLYALGFWDSRYYEYTEQTALQQIDDYRNRDLPLDVLVVDTDWRNSANGVGYDVNTKDFPDLARFMALAHGKNVRLMFNDHPEPKASGLDPTEVAFRNNGLRGLFDQGLDIWWYDRNWHVALTPPVANLQKELWGMYLYHWVTNDYFANRRPIIMAQFDGLNKRGLVENPPSYVAHRYTLQWTGDITSEYASLRREISTAVNNGMFAAFPYTSADLGGHEPAPNAPELSPECYIRWLQYGSMAPVCRVHCGQNKTRMPWTFGATALELTRKYLKMRYRLLPLFYSAARNSYDTADPILRRCDFDYPTYAEATASDQYLLGDSILVAPVIASGTRRSLWIPPGSWIDVWSGNLVSGPISTTVTAPLERLPMYIKPGTIVPLAPEMSYTGQKAWDPITLDVYPSTGRTARFSLYEDDGVSKAYQNNSYRTTQLSASVDHNKRVTVTIHPAEGSFSGAASKRSWVVRLHKPAEWANPAVASVTVDGATTPLGIRAKDPAAMPFVNSGGSPDGEVIEVTVPAAAVSQTRTIVVTYSNTGGNATPITPEFDGIMSGGIYQIRPSHALNTCLDVADAGTAEGTNVQIYTSNETNAQKWQLINVGGGYYKLISQCDPTKVLTVSNGGSADGTNVEIRSDQGTNAQKWRLISTGDGSCYLEPACALGRVLDVSHGGTTDRTNVQIWMGDDVAQQKWQLTLTGGSISVSSTASPVGEEPAKAFDGLTATKWLLGEATGWIQYDFANFKWAINQYTITSANDYPGRDPKDWTFQASNDGINWVTLDTRTNQSFANRLQKNCYRFTNQTAYRFYRLNVTANRGESCLQLAELGLLAGGPGVTFYQNANFGGVGGPVLGKGTYSLSQLNAMGIPNDWMSSLKVPAGWTVVVYQDENFAGASWTFTADSGYVGAACNDQMSSCKIQ